MIRLVIFWSERESYEEERDLYNTSDPEIIVNVVRSEGVCQGAGQPL